MGSEASPRNPNHTSLGIPSTLRAGYHTIHTQKEFVVSKNYGCYIFASLLFKKKYFFIFGAVLGLSKN